MGVDWEQTKVLNGEVGDYVTIARQERETDNWFIGAITDEEKRTISINFDFLSPDAEYEAIVYKDGNDAQWDENPTSIAIEKMIVTNGTIQSFELAEGGGLAISLILKE